MQIGKETGRTLLVLIGTILISILCAYWFLSENQNVSKISIENVTEIKKGVKHWIDHIGIEEDEIYVKGWAFKENPKVVNRMVLLRNVEDISEVWRINTVLERRPDVGELYENESYANTGFIASGKINESMKNKEYEILIYLNDYEKKILFNTGRRVTF